MTGPPEPTEPEEGSWKAVARQWAVYSQVGLMFPVAVALGFLGGHALDRWLNTSPWLALLGLGAGVMAAVRNLFRTLAREEPQEPPQRPPPGPPAAP